MNVANVQPSVNGQPSQSPKSLQSEPSQPYLPGQGPDHQVEPFCPIERRVIRTLIPVIGVAGFAVYCWLKNHRLRRQWSVMATHHDIAKGVGQSVSTVQRAIEKLRSVKLIGLTSGKALGNANYYYFLGGGGSVTQTEGVGQIERGGSVTQSEGGRSHRPTSTETKYLETGGFPCTLVEADNLSPSSSSERVGQQPTTTLREVPEILSEKLTDIELPASWWMDPEILRNNYTGRGRSAPPLWIHFDPDALRRLWGGSVKARGSVTPEEVIEATLAKIQEQARRRDLRKPWVGFLIVAVPRSLEGVGHA
jgi:hypothetical protein